MKTRPHHIRSWLLVAVLAVLAAACSTGGATGVASLSEVSDVPAQDQSPMDDDVSDEESILAFAACMRDQGLDDFEDPQIDSDGAVTFGFRDLAQAGDVDRETIRSAMAACRDHLDGLALGPGTTDRTEIEDDLYEFAACMRDHGYDMPDPDFSAAPGQGSGEGPFAGIDRDDPTFQSALESCEDVFGGTIRLGGPGGPGRGPEG